MPEPVPPTPLADALDKVGDRWALLIVDALISGAARFNEIQAGVDGIATNVLSQRLRHLQAAGVVIARPYADRPRRYRYDLTAAGRELAGVLQLLAHWGATGNPAGGPTHDVCGTPLEVHLWCPTCNRTVNDEEGGQDDVIYA